MCRRSLVVTALLLAGSGRAAAQGTNVWNGTGTDWLSAGTWSLGRLPTAADEVVFENYTRFGSSALPFLSGNAVAGSMVFDIGFAGFDVTNGLRGNGNALTLGTGGVMTDSPLRFRGGTSQLGFDNLTINLAAGTSLSGRAAATGFFDLGTNTRLTLTNGSHINAGSLPVTVSGGQLTLDATSRVTAGNLRFFGGSLTLIGGSAANPLPATAFSLARLDAQAGQVGVGLNQAFNPPVGQVARRVDATFAGLTNPTGRALVSVTVQANPFDNPDPARMFLTNSAGLVAGGVVQANGTPFLLLNNRWATYDAANGVVAAATVTRNGSANLSATAAGEHVLTSLSTAPTLTQSISPGTLVVTSTTGTLNLGGFTLTTNGLLASPSGGGVVITNGTLAGTPGAARQFVVTNGLASVAANMGGASGPLVKSGNGALILTGTTDQLSFTDPATDVTLNAGQLQVRLTGGQANFGSNNLLQIRGGSLLVDAGGTAVNFTRSLGTGAGQVNWSAGAGDSGSGGFGVAGLAGGSLTVNIGGAAQPLVWDGQTGDSRFFVRDGMLLLLNTTGRDSITGPATGRVMTVANPIALDDGTAGARTSRQIRLFGNINFTPDFRPAAERTRFVGGFTGSASTNLLFEGAGFFELPTASTHAGDTQITTYLIASNTTGSATGTGNVTFNQGILFGNGILAPASGKDVAFHGGFLYLRSDAGPGTPTIGSPGADNDLLFRTRFPATGSTPAGLVAYLTGAGQAGRVTVRGTGRINLDAGTLLAIGIDPGFTGNAATAIGVIDNQTPNPIEGQFTLSTTAGGTGAVIPNEGTVEVDGLYRFQVTYTGQVTGGTVLTSGGNDLVFYNFVPIPEPSGLLAAAAVGLIGRVVVRRRRR